MEKLTAAEVAMIDSLRKEAAEVKDCFTKFAFQAIGIAVAVLGYMALHHENLYASLISTAVVIQLLLVAARVGTHKYHTANRNYGFELYLRHVADQRPSPEDWVQPVTWEEAILAWRVVQATLFRFLYFEQFPFPNWLRWKFRSREKRWFEPQSLVNAGGAKTNDSRGLEKAAYHAGSYLGTMHSFLFSLSVIALVPAVISLHEKWNYSIPLWRQKEAAVGLACLGLLMLVLFTALARNYVRRTILEKGLLCIFSCSIMWKAVIAAHHRALCEAEGDSTGSRYLHELARQASQITGQAFEIEKWIKDSGARGKGEAANHTT
jgi:hypothetical protein